MSVVYNHLGYEILTPNGFESFTGIRSSAHPACLLITFSDASTLTTSFNHPILVGSTFVEAKGLMIGDVVSGKEVVDVEVIEGQIELYDLLDTGKDSSYYTNGVVSHNCFFIGSSNTLISAQALTSMVMQEPIYSTEELAIYHQPRRLDPHGDKDDPKNKDHAYVLTVDVSRGLGMDYSAFSVIDVTEFPYHQVARFKSNTVSPTMFPNFIYDAARQYNNAFVLIETNDIGQQVADILWQELEYECVIRTVTNGRSGQVISQGHKRNSKLGVKTSAPVKSIGCSTLKALIENKKLLIHDEDTFDELTKFVQIRNSYAAEPGTDNHDDLVMTLVLFGWLSSQQFFKDFTQSSLRSQLSEDYSKQMEESMLPFGFIDDGLSNANTFIDVHGETWTEVEVDRHLCDQDSFWNLDDQDITPEERMRNLQMLHAGWLSRNTPK